MPQDQAPKKTTSFFEFWPAWAMYLPVYIQWLFLSIRYRSLTVPFLANPNLRLSGMTGVGKSELMVQANGKAKDVILPWIKCDISTADSMEQAKDFIAQAKDNGIELPFVSKPDIGCRGIGLKLIDTAEKLADAIEFYPEGAAMICQKMASYEPEVGIFYVKDPKTGHVDIPSMTQKTLPRVTGDGVMTLGQLIEADPRAGELKRLYYERHKDNWDTIPKKGEKIRLVFSASHSKGSIFTDVRHHVTPELTKAVDEIMSGLPEFYYGRLDVKFKDLESLKRGKTLQIVEVNGASAESIHIWDKDASFIEAYRALMWQYRTLFRIGDHHRKNGRRAPSIKEFYQGYKLEKELSKHYPLTD